MAFKDLILRLALCPVDAGELWPLLARSPDIAALHDAHEKCLHLLLSELSLAIATHELDVTVSTDRDLVLA